MNETSRRLLYILHAGLVEIRNLAMAQGGQAQIAVLSDVLEIIPAALLEPSAEALAVIRAELQRYGAQFPTGTRFSRILDGEGVPPPFS